MDIKQALNATALITLGKDMSFRDYAQGAFRMRGIGAGQTLRIVMIPEVKKLIVANLASAAGASFAEQQKILATEAHLLPQQVSLVDICAWLVINSMKTEKVQFNMLIEQCLENLWRKHALNDLFKKYTHVGIHAGGASRVERNLVLPAADEAVLGQAIDVFRDRVDYSISNLIDPPKNFLARLQTTVREHQAAFIRTSNDQNDVDTVLGWVTSAQTKPPAVIDVQLQVDEARTEGEDQKDRAFNSEQVQEQEQEQEQEQGQ
jgi:hypothetical protein